MKRFLLALLVGLSALSSCVTSEGYETTARGDFEALWQIIDERYCFFDFKKQEYGLDWNEVHKRYSAQINDTLSRRALFQILGKMTQELRDGHVNLWTPFDIARYSAWYEAYPTNYSDSLERKYLGESSEHQLASSLKYRVLRDNIGYIRCASFTSAIGTANLHEVMRYLATCDGVIVDIRSNGGGYITAASTLASAFVNESRTVGYISHKTGRGHNDFSTPIPITLDPLKGLRWQKPVVVLTNRRTYSAANAFAMYMGALPNVTLMGDRTGGGSGMPFSSELPGGWGIRFSASPVYDLDMQHTEFGIAPDIKVSITHEDYRNDIDTILERALDFLRDKAKN